MNNTILKEIDNHPISIAMSAAVPLWIISIKENGGLSNQDFVEAKEACDLLGPKGDILLFGGGKKGEVADIFNRTAKAIAVLSFCPGGVNIFNQHFEANEILKRFRKKRRLIKLDE